MRLVEETETHVLVRLLSLLLLLGLLSGSGLTTSGGSATGSSRGSTTAGADVGKEVLDVLALKSLSFVLANVSLGVSIFGSWLEVVPWRRWRSRWARRPRHQQP